jgi:single-strand DNA-binding protein
MLIGRLTREPETTSLQSGASVTKFSLAVGRSRKNPHTGQWENDPNPLYIDCEAWTNKDGKGVGKAATFLTKGSQVFVEGRLETDSWDDKNTGQKRSKIKLNVQVIEFLDSKQSDGQQQPRNGAESLTQQHDDAGDDDGDGINLPF